MGGAEGKVAFIDTEGTFRPERHTCFVLHTKSLGYANSAVYRIKQISERFGLYAEVEAFFRTTIQSH